MRQLPPTPAVAIAGVLLLRLASLLALHIHSHLVGEDGFNSFPYGGLDDGRYYYTTAQQLADGIEPPYVLNPFPRVLAVLMDLGIRDLLALKMISFAVGSIGVVAAASLAWNLGAQLNEVGRRWTVTIAVVLAGLFPSNVFWTTNSLMRDGWIFSFTLVAACCFFGAIPSRLQLIRWPLGIVSLAGATLFRPYVLVVFVAALLSARFWFLNPMTRLKPRPGPVAIRLIAVAGVFIVGCLVAAPVLFDATGFNILEWRSQEELLGKGSSLGFRFTDTSWPLVIAYYFISFISNAVGPLPFQIKSANQTLVFVELPFFVIIAAGLFKSRFESRLLRFCALFGLYWLLLLGLWNDVLGNGARNRIMAWPLLALAASPAIARYVMNKRNSTEEAGAPRTLDLQQAELQPVRVGADGVDVDAVSPAGQALPVADSTDLRRFGDGLIDYPHTGVASSGASSWPPVRRERRLVADNSWNPVRTTTRPAAVEVVVLFDEDDEVEADPLFVPRVPERPFRGER